MQGYVRPSTINAGSQWKRVKKIKERWRRQLLISRVLIFIKRVFFLIVFARVYRVGLKTSLFCKFWISSSCNLSVRSHNTFSLSVFCIFDSLVLQVKFDFLKFLL